MDGTPALWTACMGQPFGASCCSSTQWLPSTSLPHQCTQRHICQGKVRVSSLQQASSPVCTDVNTMSHSLFQTSFGEMMHRLLAMPAFRTVFFKEDGRGGWRVPAINETCCIRPVFANFLDAVGAQVTSHGTHISHGTHVQSVLLVSRHL